MGGDSSGATPTGSSGLVRVSVPSIAATTSPALSSSTTRHGTNPAATSRPAPGVPGTGRGAAVPETISAAMAAQARGSGFGLPVARMLTERLGGE